MGVTVTQSTDADGFPTITTITKIDETTTVRGLRLTGKVVIVGGIRDGSCDYTSYNNQHPDSKEIFQKQGCMCGDLAVGGFRIPEKVKLAVLVFDGTGWHTLDNRQGWDWLIGGGHMITSAYSSSAKAGRVRKAQMLCAMLPRYKNYIVEWVADSKCYILRA